MTRAPGPGVLALGWCAELWPDGAGVLTGHSIRVLDARQLRVWRAAHGSPVHPEGAPWTAADVAAAVDLPAAEVDDVLASLAALDLVAGIDPADPGPAAERLTLLPLAEGWGNTPEEPTVFRYGLGGTELARLPRVLYDAVSLAGRWPDLRTACSELAALARQAGVPAPEDADGDALLRRLAGALPRLCGSSVVALHPAGEVR
ncbi:hypothetical protein [Blastococcus sp. TF02A-26]|uniref:hypothetical protein n=1 Tax=Blastococcus sp. TF02A-26 TaxID=2250577 RepID=UPI000DE865EC|nr:hypothetical protein [Blastococcus sp. TF02A-26]RBY86106.1 hypothetical protein DQ240_09835 [Blastococcus sp. TF02A-26]